MSLHVGQCALVGQLRKAKQDYEPLLSHRAVSRVGAERWFPHSELTAETAMPGHGLAADCKDSLSTLLREAARLVSASRRKTCSSGTCGPQQSSARCVLRQHTAIPPSPAREHLRSTHWLICAQVEERRDASLAIRPMGACGHACNDACSQKSLIRVLLAKPALAISYASIPVQP